MSNQRQHNSLAQLVTWAKTGHTNKQLELARDEKTPNAILSLLAQSPSHDVCAAVAANKSAEPTALRKLATDRQAHVRLAVARNPSADISILHQLADDPDKEVRAEIAYNESADSSILRRFVGDNDAGVRLVIAQHKNADVDILKKLLQDPHAKVRLAVAQHPNADRHIMRRLYDDSEQSVRLAVAKNPNTDGATLEKLAGDFDPQIQLAVAQHTKADTGVLLRLIQVDHWPILSTVMARHNLDDEVLERLLDKDHPQHQQLAQAFLKNVHVSDRAMRPLVGKLSRRVGVLIAKHPSISSETLRALVEAKRITNKAQRLDDIRERLWRCLPIYNAVVNNAKTDTATLSIMIEDVHRAEWPILPAGVLGMTSSDGHYDARDARDTRDARDARDRQEHEGYEKHCYQFVVKVLRHPHCDRSIVSLVEQALSKKQAVGGAKNMQAYYQQTQHFDVINKAIDAFWKQQQEQNANISAYTSRNEARLDGRNDSRNAGRNDGGRNDGNETNSNSYQTGSFSSYKPSSALIASNMGNPILQDDDEHDNYDIHDSRDALIAVAASLAQMPTPKQSSSNSPAPAASISISASMTATAANASPASVQTPAQTPTLTPIDLVEEDAEELLLLLEDPNISRNLLEKLAMHSDDAVCCAVAAHPATNRTMLAKLAEDRSHRVRQSVAQNVNLDLSSAEKLVNDTNIDVRRTLAQNLQCPLPVLQKLADDIDSSVRKLVSSRLPTSDIDFYMRLGSRTSLECRNGYPATYLRPAELDDVANSALQNQSFWRAYLVADHPNTDVKTLAKLAVFPLAQVRSAVATNKNTHGAVLAMLADDDDDEVRTHARENRSKAWLRVFADDPHAMRQAKLE